MWYITNGTSYYPSGRPVKGSTSAHAQREEFPNLKTVVSKCARYNFMDKASTNKVAVIKEKGLYHQ